MHSLGGYPSCLRKSNLPNGVLERYRRRFTKRVASRVHTHEKEEEERRKRVDDRSEEEEAHRVDEE